MAVKDVMKKGLPARRDEESPFSLLRQEMNKLFDNFFHGFDLEAFGKRSGLFNPNVDVVESAKDIKITAELPGMAEKDIDVSLNKDSITIKGEKKEESEDKGKDYYRMERSYGSFTRTIPLPKEVDLEKADATFRNGILTVTLSKTPKAVKETKKIKVKTT